MMRPNHGTRGLLALALGIWSVVVVTSGVAGWIVASHAGEGADSSGVVLGTSHAVGPITP